MKTQRENKWEEAKINSKVEELSLKEMGKNAGGCIVFHDGKYWVVEEPPTKGPYLYYTTPFSR